MPVIATPITRWICIRTAAEAVSVGLAQGFKLEKIYEAMPEKLARGRNRR